jgi:DNA-directed RNA polymerase specialized sigma24 family protein
MDIIKMLQDAYMAHINLRTIKDMLDDADWLGGGGKMPHISKGSAGGSADPTAKAAERLTSMRHNLEAAREEALKTYNAAIKALNELPDVELRKILYLRHLKNLKWHEIAIKFGAGYSSDKLKQRYSRYKRSLSS